MFYLKLRNIIKELSMKKAHTIVNLELLNQKPVDKKAKMN